MDAIVVEVRRNGIVEAVHRVHAVAVRDGAVVAEAGDGPHACFLRSSSKPIQALPLARARDDLDDRDLAIASASHRATDDQIAAVRALLAKAPATEDDLELGPQAGRPAGRIFNNCSGKHAGHARALPRARLGRPRATALRDTPCRRPASPRTPRRPRSIPRSSPTGVDGCGILTFALPLERMAYAFSRFEALPGAARVVDAMCAHPDLVGGPDGADFRLMRAAPGWFAKGGAEGLLCAGGPGGIGIALKSEDGSSRPLEPALAAFLGPLGVDLPGLAEVPIVNSRGERVGECVVNSS